MPKIPLSTDQIDQIVLLISSPKFEETAQFYLKVGQILAKTSMETVTPAICRNVQMVLTPSSTPSAGFVLFTNDCQKEEFFHDPDGRPIRLCSEHSELLERSQMMPEGTIIILRSSCIETTRTYYEQIHQCVEEQHGNGPRHYSINWDNGPITEIYPKRKSCLGSVEFVFQSRNLKQVAREMDLQGFLPISTTEKSMTLQDPDGRVVNILGDVEKDNTTL